MTVAPVDQTIHRIRAYRSAAGLSVKRLATLAGMTTSTLRPIDSETWNPTADTLRKLEAVIPEGWQPGDEVAPEAGGEPSASDGKEAA